VILDHFKLLGNIKAGYDTWIVMCSAPYMIARCALAIIRGSKTVAYIEEVAKQQAPHSAKA
jgi:hypothetical protein